MQILGEVGRTGRPYGPYEGEARDREGRPGWLLSTVIGLPGDVARGEPPMIFVCLDVDITDHKRAEAELRVLNAELESRIEERTRSLSIANTELEQALQTVREVVPQVPPLCSAAPVAAIDAACLREQASQLRHALRRGGLDEEALAAMEHAAGATAYRGVLGELRQALDDFDFDQALSLLDRLLLQLQDEETTRS